MSREFKPGDVALVEAGCWANRKVALRLDEGWSHVNGVNVDGDGIVSPVRPLVVIDPEDREEVERLLRAYYPNGDYALGTLLDQMQAALRSLIEPPKPEEPQGLGAVVESASGGRWIRVGSHALPRPWAAEHNVGGNMAGWTTYAEIDVVRVLSEGVAA